MAWGVCLGLSGCDRMSRERPETVGLELSGDRVPALLTRGREGAPGIVVLAESDLDSWAPMLSRWSVRGWHGIAVTCRDAAFRPEDAPRWSTLCEAAMNRLIRAGTDAENMALVGEGTLGAFALRMAAQLPTIQAAVMVSPVSAGPEWDPEKIIREIRDCPTLVVSCENDMVSDTIAERVKQAAPVFSEWRRYQGAERGVALLLSRPVAVQEMEDWLATILEAPKPTAGNPSAS